MFSLPTLSFEYHELEPYIDTKTMDIHYNKHHAGYTSKLNAAIEGTDLETKTIEEILQNLDLENNAVRNNGGGYYNHCLFWDILSPNGGGEPTGLLSEKINEQFGSFENFKTEFSNAAATRFGSGWAWLCVKPDGSLCVSNTANQDNPLMPSIGCDHVTPILGLDVWEHAYYLNYQNRRPDYIEAFFKVVDWTKVARKMEQVLRKR
ncbi:superoxide dismutase [bacterium DOLZORAL124_38_8]|nr:MAG: superoxide dismutase [bacterium DOLZORAL124_38_8]